MISLRGGAFCGNKNFVLASRSSKPLASMVKMSCLLHTSADLHFSVFGGGFAAGCCFSRSLWPLCEDPLFKRKIGVRKIDGKKTSAATTYQPFTDHQEDFWKVLGVQQIRNCLPQCQNRRVLPKKNNKKRCRCSFYVNQPPENCGTVKSAGPHRSAAQSLWHWADQFPLQITVERIHRCVVKIVDLLRLKDWKNLQSTWGCKTDILRLIYQYCPCRTC